MSISEFWVDGAGENHFDERSSDYIKDIYTTFENKMPDAFVTISISAHPLSLIPFVHTYTLITITHNGQTFRASFALQL